MKDGGIDITPLRNLIHEVIDEDAIRKSGKEFCLLTFSLSDFRELDLSVEDIPEGLLEDFLLASAYLIGFKMNVSTERNISMEALLIMYP